MIQQQNLHNFCLLDLVVVMQRNKCTYSNFFMYFYIEKPPAKQLCKFCSHFIIFKKKKFYTTWVPYLCYDYEELKQEHHHTTPHTEDISNKNKL